MNEEVNIVFDQEDIAANKVIVILSVVFPILFFLPLITCKDSPYGRFYANQALILFIAGAVCGFIPIVGPVISFVLWILVLIPACKGEAKKLPFIGNFDILK